MSKRQIQAGLTRTAGAPFNQVRCVTPLAAVLDLALDLTSATLPKMDN